MSEPPPFPVPRGMEWDAVRKRFFKPAPGTARAAIANGYGGGRSSSSSSSSSDGTRSSKRKQTSREARGAKDVYEEQLNVGEASKGACEPVLLSRFAGSTALRRGNRRAHLLTTPTIADVQATQQSVARTALSRAALVRTACPYATQTMRLLDAPRTSVRMLSSTSLGALLFFCPTSDEVRGMDVGSGTEEAFRVERGWKAKHKPFQSSAAISYPETTDYVGEPNVARPNSSAIDGPYLTFFSSPSLVRTLRLSTRSTSQTTGRCFQAERMAQCSVDSQWCESGVPTVCTRDLDDSVQNCVVVLIGIGRRFAVQRATGARHPSRLDKQQCARLDGNVKSDILSCDISFNGQQALLGLRNGQVHVVRIPPQIDVLSAHAYGRLQSQQLACTYNSAITNVKWTSLDDFIVVTVSGEVHLISLQTPDVPLLEYAGHVNRWMVDVAMAFDMSNRLFALAGQDRHVRIWSFDEPLSLSSTTSSIDDERRTLFATPLPEPILSLTFCQRQDVSRLEAQQNIVFLPRDLPALAAYCGDGAVRFYE